MKNPEALKNIVREKYTEIAKQDKALNQSSCCGAGGSSAEVYNIMTDDYSLGYIKEMGFGDISIKRKRTL